MTLGNRIKFVGGTLSQDEFTEILGAKRNTVSALECNMIKPGEAFLLRMYEKFNVNLN